MIENGRKKASDDDNDDDGKVVEDCITKKRVDEQLESHTNTHAHAHTHNIRDCFDRVSENATSLF